jgi:hypothetical protein
MADLFLIIFDLAAVAVLVFGLYFPRHRRRDMVVAYLVVNIAVLAVSDALLASTVSAGLGLGLFGVLSIIRLRSFELAQHEVAYYFGALALGLLGGLTTSAGWVAPMAMAMILAALFIGDHPSLFSMYRSQSVTLDAACFSESEVRAQLADMLDGRLHRVTIRRVDLVRDTTIVDITYQIDRRLRTEAVIAEPRG